MSVGSAGDIEWVWAARTIWNECGYESGAGKAARGKPEA